MINTEKVGTEQDRLLGLGTLMDNQQNLEQVQIPSSSSMLSEKASELLHLNFGCIIILGLLLTSHPSRLKHHSIYDSIISSVWLSECWGSASVTVYISFLDGAYFLQQAFFFPNASANFDHVYSKGYIIFFFSVSYNFWIFFNFTFEKATRNLNANNFWSSSSHNQVTIRGSLHSVVGLIFSVVLGRFFWAWFGNLVYLVWLIA